MTPTAEQIRTGFIDFFKEKGHKFVPSSPIVPIGDQTLLFANAGMNQFKDIFLGLAPPDCPRAANSQKCLRVSGKHNDLEEVGKDSYHHTFFEMLGNWSFDDYFKKEAIRWAWQLLTEVWNINPDQLWATVFAGDESEGLPEDGEAAKLWIRVTPIPADRVLRFGRKDNFWEMGDVGPCGPCSEIHIDLGPDACDKKDVPGHKCAVNVGCARFIELWNLVFIQYNRGDDGKLSPLGAKYVDTGAGLERIAAVLQNKKTNYDTDLFMPIITRTGELTGRKYSAIPHDKTDNAFRVIADHVRALVFAITDGATPSNEGRGYVVRRILRRASRFGRQFDMHEPFIYKLVPTVTDCLGDAFPEIEQRADYVSTVIEAEEASFGRTLDRGLEIFNEAAEKAKAARDKIITGEDAFQLYDTYGFPVDLTRLMADERGLKVDETGFEKLMNQQRKRARAAQKTASLTLDLGQAELPTTEDLHKYETDTCKATVVGFIHEGAFRNAGELDAGAEAGIILDKTCFYAEAGGQVGDCGTVKSDSANFVVETTTRIANSVVHRGKVVEGCFAVGDKVTAAVSKDRNSVRKNHTATHLLQWALREVLGSAAAQQGSLVGPDYLRFDFTYPKAMTAKQISKVEQLVREKVAEDLPVTCTVLPRAEAEKLGAMALFGEKYGDEVRVVAIGTDSDDRLQQAFSKEFCGGTHVDNISSIGSFKIIREESISAGVRRITALTGAGLTAFLENRSRIIDQLSEMLKVPAEDIPSRVKRLLDDNKKLAKQLKSAAKQGGADVMAEARKLLEKADKVGESLIIVGKLSPTGAEQARTAVDMLKKKAKSAVIVLGFAEEDKATLIAGVTDDLVKKHIKAGDIIKTIAPIVEGGGGGRPQMAQAGGKKPQKIPEALEKAAEIIKQKLT